MSVLTLGNAAPFQRVRVDDQKQETRRVEFDDDHEREHVYAFPKDMPLGERLALVDRTWRQDHSDAEPSWVESDDDLLAQAAASTLGSKVGRPKGWKGVELPDLGPRASIGGGALHHDPEFERRLRLASADDVSRVQRAMVWGERLAAARRAGISPAAVRLGAIVALRVNSGRDFQSDVMSGTSAQPAAANYIALTANSSAAAAGDTTLTGEITTGGGGLVRAQAAYAHTASALTYTLIKTFTANGSDSLPVTVAKIGVFNASSSGTLVFESLLNATATLTTSGDQLQITETVNIT